MLKALHEGQAQLRRRLTPVPNTPRSVEKHEEYLCQAFKTASFSFLQDLINSLLLSECVYKYVNDSDGRAISALQDFQAQFPDRLVSLRRVEVSRPHVAHRYLLGASDTALYAAFVGTKFPRDLLTDASFVEELVWKEEPLAAAARPQAVPAAHRGFLNRATSIPIEWLYHEAQTSNRKLIVCGHSLGGAVAALSTLRLLKQLPADHQPNVQCICFGSPAVGNAALAELVRTSGWDSLFHSVALPGDIIPWLWALRATPAEAEAVAEQLQAPEIDSDSLPAASGAGGVPATRAAGSQLPWWQLQRRQPGQPAQAGAAMSQAAGFSNEHQKGSDTPKPGVEENSHSHALQQPSQEAPAATLTRLQQLQGLARSAGTRLSSAGARVGTAVRFWPGFVHFGQQHMWEPDPTQPLLPPSTLQSLRSTLTLAAHRMPAYRAQALRICSTAGMLPGSSALIAAEHVITTGQVVTPMSMQHVVAHMGPFLPAGPLVPGPVPEAPRWQAARARLPLLSRGHQQMQPTAQVRVTAVGRGLQGASSAQIVVSGLSTGLYTSAWVQLPRPCALPPPRPAEPQQQQLLPGRMLNSIASRVQGLLPGLFGRAPHQQKGPAQLHPDLAFTLTMPEAVARHAVDQADQGCMRLQCRADMASCTALAHATCPVAWVVACEPGNTSRSTGWGTRWRKLFARQKKRNCSSKEDLSAAPEAERQKVSQGIRLVHLDEVEGTGPIVLPSGASALCQLIQHASVSWGSQCSAMAEESDGELLSQPPSLVIIEHRAYQNLAERERRVLTELGATCRAFNVPMLIFLTPGSVMGQLKLQYAAKGCAALYQVPEQQVVSLARSLQGSDVLCDQTVGGHGAQMQDDVAQARLALFWMAMQGSVPLQPTSKL